MRVTRYPASQDLPLPRGKLSAAVSTPGAVAPAMNFHWNGLSWSIFNYTYVLTHRRSGGGKGAPGAVMRSVVNFDFDYPATHGTVSRKWFVANDVDSLSPVMVACVVAVFVNR